MTDEQINQLFELKQKLDSGQITQEEFDVQKKVIFRTDNSSEVEKYNNPTHENKKWIRVLLLSLLGLGAFIAICIWIQSTSNKRPDPVPMGLTDINPIEEHAQQPFDESSSVTIEPKTPHYNTGNWTKENFINEYGEDTYEPQFKLHLYVENTTTHKDYNLYVIYKPNEYFELNGMDEYWGYNKLKVRNDNTGSEVAISYKTYTRKHTQNYIRIEQKKSISQFFELLEDGEFTMLLNDNDVCHVNSRSTGLSESLLKYKVYDPHIPVTSFGSDGIKYLEHYAKAWKQFVIKNYGSDAIINHDSIFGAYGLLYFDDDNVPDLYINYSLHSEYKGDRLIFCYKNGTIQMYDLKGDFIPGDMEYIPRKSILSVVTEDLGETERIIWQVENNKAKELVSFYSNIDGGFSIYYKDTVGTETSEEKFNSELYRLFYSKGEAWSFPGRPIGVLSDYVRRMK